MRKILFIIVLMFPIIVFAKDEKLIDYIQQIVVEANGNEDSMDLIGETGLAYDNTVDKNLRYVGKNPNNYVLFNDELWRIIGVMNNVEDDKGQKASRIKIIREEPIGSYAWGTSPSDVNRGWGDNEWTHSNMLVVLTNYYNSTKGTCHNRNYEEIDCDFSHNGLSKEARLMTIPVKWNIAAIDPNYFGYKVSESYTKERSNTISKRCTASNCGDNGFEGSKRTPIWIGNIGLIYPSDYGYATSGAGSNEERDKCINQGYFGVEGIQAKGWLDRQVCTSDDWLLLDHISGYWTMNPHYNSYHEAVSIHQKEPGRTMAYADKKVYPVLYLNDNVYLYSGDGSKENPYVLVGYRIIVEGDKDSIKTKNGTKLSDLSAGTEVILEVFKEGFVLGEFKIFDLEGNEIEYEEISDKEYKFVMPASDVKVVAKFIKNEENPETSVQSVLVILIVITMTAILFVASFRRLKD